jgi:nucleoid-associated protein YgaU
MSLAVNYAPLLDTPDRARRDDRPLAPVVTLQAPSAQSIAAPVRLTRRGVIVLSAVVAAVAVAVVVVAWLSAPAAASRVGGPQRAPALVTVRAGDTLWSIAGRVAPQRAPQAEVALLQRLNHLPGVALAPGQRLRTR